MFDVSYTHPDRKRDWKKTGKLVFGLFVMYASVITAVLFAIR